jgi:hypothetical protein
MTDLTKEQLAIFDADQIRFHRNMEGLEAYGTPVNAVEAAGALTIGAIGTVDDTFTIGDKVYTVVANGTAAADGEVNAGTDKATFQTAVKAAINGTDGYNVEHEDVVCGAIAGDDYPITAKVAGAAGNDIVTESDFTSGSNLFGAATLEDGVDGTLGVQGQPMFDDTYLYICAAENTVADKNWRRIDLGSAF